MLLMIMNHNHSFVILYMLLKLVMLLLNYVQFVLLLIVV